MQKNKWSIQLVSIVYWGMNENLKQHKFLLQGISDKHYGIWEQKTKCLFNNVDVCDNTHDAWERSRSEKCIWQNINVS